MAFVATKALSPSGRSTRERKMMAVAVLERGRDKFMYTVKTSVGETLMSWIAVLKLNVSIDEMLFAEHNEITELQMSIEYYLKSCCSVLTTGQSGVDWCVLQQFIVTNTNADRVITRHMPFHELLGIANPDSVQIRTNSERLEVFTEGWFGSKVSTEAVMRGSISEDAVLKTLNTQASVDEGFEVGVL